MRGYMVNNHLNCKIIFDICQQFIAKFVLYFFSTLVIFFYGCLYKLLVGILGGILLCAWI